MAAKIRLSVAVGDYEIIRALKEGAVQADGLELIVLTGHGPRERHWRMARNQEFDVCEFNIGGYLMARDHGEPLTAIPVFLHRRFRHGFAFVHIDSGIKHPKDLIGKRVGGTNFQPAGNIWLRGIFEEHYGVPHKEITWVVESGYPKWLEARMTAAPAPCEVKPWAASILMIRVPIVRMIRHPPIYVPSAIAVAAETTTHEGTSKLLALRLPFAISAKVITPIVFCASLVP